MCCRIKIPENIAHVLQKLEKNGFEGYLVGGCVRDALMEKQPNDYDITTSSFPEETKKVFESYRLIETGIKHGTVTILSEGEPIEVTTFRIDGEYKDNRHPESVLFTRDIVKDLARRDFTVNAMAYNPESGLVDPFDGITDLNNGIIRCVGDPDKRFNEDRLRILRAVRFASTLGFKIEKQTSDSIKRNAYLLKGIAAERIYVEMKKLLCGKNAGAILSEYSDVFKVFAENVNSAQTAQLVEKCMNDAPVRLAAWLISSGKDTARKVMQNLKSDKKTLEFVTNLVDAFSKPCVSDRLSIKRMFADFGEDFCKSYASIAKASDADFKEKAFLSELENLIMSNPCLKVSDLAVNGKILSKLGVEKGKQMGEILNHLFQLVFTEKLENDRTILCEKVRDIISNSNAGE